jgi:ribosomal protein S15P/S13E
MWDDMISKVDLETQEAKVRRMVKYLHENAYALPQAKTFSWTRYRPFRKT